ncbi:MAG: thymidine phosphorylase [Acidobacteriota bacterium]|jgi:pyrimidine-nucleoside phosphorylase/thymidine phosphorylase
MVFLDIIEKKRNGGELSAAEIDWMIERYVIGDIADYQMSSLLMATMWRGLSDAETAELTHAMAASGVQFDFSDIAGPKIDKHSTGGVGDKVSLLLAPLASACGCIVPMVSGRGLGHTGGTLDKLEAIPGFRTDLSEKAFRRQLGDIGVAMGAQTADLVPADRKLYELRSLTATVPQTGLITASILSKKIAEGAEGLVLDVKTGRGAFMQRLEDAHRLADRLYQVAGLAGLRCSVLITDMDQPLGNAVGNALEVSESIAVLARDAGRPVDLEEITVALTAEMLLLGGLAESHEAARAAVAEALDSGAALERLGRLIAAQGGDAAVVEDRSLLPQASSETVLRAPDGGWIGGIDARRVGDAALALGAGRTRREDPLDPAAGIVLHAKCGERLERDEPWVTLYYGAGADLERAVTRLEEALEVSPERPAEVPLIKERRA